MLAFIDNFLNRITMYRLLLYVLLGLLGVAATFSLLGWLPFSALSILLSTAFITLICLVTNELFSKVYEAPTNVESVYITALILALLITPIASIHDVQYFALAGWASIFAMGTKYFLAIKKKHIFNPAAIAVVITALSITQSASWWVGTGVLFPFVLIGGLLIVRKIRRFDLVLSFTAAAMGTIFAFTLYKGTGLHPILLKQIFLDSPLVFFATIMLTEPLTTPPKRHERILYGALTGFLFAPLVHIGSFYSTPELALVIGNIASYLMSPKEKLLLTLKEVKQMTSDVYDFAFATDMPLKFKPGQYLEWTLGHEKSDSRGNRRYFTIASAPTESDIHLGVKFYPNSSTFKQTLLEMKPGQTLVASQLAGEFTLPKDKNEKVVFIAGGIGITPFVSMLNHLLHNKEKRDIVLLYGNKTSADVAYIEVCERAEKALGIRVIHVLSDEPSKAWKGKRGYINATIIEQEIPDYQSRTFYVSGTHAMVVGCKKALSTLNVPHNHIHTDFFPGFV